MSRTEFFRRTLLSVGIFAVLPCVLPAQEHGAQETRSPGPAPAVSVLHVKSESLLRVDFPGRKSWGHGEKGAELEGRLSLPLYAGEHIVAPAGSAIRVTVNSVEKIREDLGFWRKTGRGIVRAFNPLETSRPTEYRVELRAADLVLPTGEVLSLDARVLRASSGVPVQPKTKSSPGVGAGREKSKATATLLMALRREALFSVPAESNLAPVMATGEQRVARAYLLTALRASLNHSGDKFRGQLAEPVRIDDRVFGPGTVLEGTVIRSVAPRILSRAGNLYLRVDRIVPSEGEPLRVDGTLSAAEADARSAERRVR